MQNNSFSTPDEIALRWMPQSLINEKRILVQVIAWGHQAITWVKLDPDPFPSYDVTMRLWVIPKYYVAIMAVIPLKSIWWRFPDLLPSMQAAGFSSPTNVDFHKCRHIQMS